MLQIYRKQISLKKKVTKKNNLKIIKIIPDPNSLVYTY